MLFSNLGAGVLKRVEGACGVCVCVHIWEWLFVAQLVNERLAFSTLLPLTNRSLGLWGSHCKSVIRGLGV